MAQLVSDKGQLCNSLALLCATTSQLICVLKTPLFLQASELMGSKFQRESTAAAENHFCLTYMNTAHVLACPEAVHCRVCLPNQKAMPGPCACGLNAARFVS